MIDHRTRLLNEVCDLGKLEGYRTILDQLFNEIANKGCKISTRYDVEYCNIESSSNGGSHIRMSLKNVKEPLDIIWKLLHEYGHFLSGPQKPGDSLLEREELAWRYADEVLVKFPDLMVHREDYQRCKEECLESYRKFSGSN